MGMKERSEERRKRIVGNIAHSHEEAEEWDLEFWLSMTPQQRLSALASIREDIAKIRAGRKRRLRKVSEEHENDA